MKIENISQYTYSTFWHGVSISPGGSTNVSTEFLQSFNVLGGCINLADSKSTKNIAEKLPFEVKTAEIEMVGL